MNIDFNQDKIKIYLTFNGKLNKLQIRHRLISLTLKQLNCIHTQRSYAHAAALKKCKFLNFAQPLHSFERFLE